MSLEPLACFSFLLRFLVSLSSLPSLITNCFCPGHCWLAFRLPLLNKFPLDRLMHCYPSWVSVLEGIPHGTIKRLPQMFSACTSGDSSFYLRIHLGWGPVTGGHLEWPSRSQGCSVHNNHRLPWGLPRPGAVGCPPGGKKSKKEVPHESKSQSLKSEGDIRSSSLTFCMAQAPSSAQPSAQ